MGFGVIVPQGWRLDLVGDDRDFERMVSVLRAAEKLGFNHVWLYDHFITYPEIKYYPVFECWSTLAAFAGLTKKIRLGSIVTCNLYRYPTVLAKMASTLDVISGGRLEFGIGACWYEEDFRRFGIPFPKLRQRLEMLDEALRIIKSMWTEKETWFNGKYYRVEGAINYPKPLQKPHPPILIGGFGPKIMARIIARHADKCNFFGTPSEFKWKVNILERHCRVIGRNPDEIVKTLTITVVIAETDDEFKKFLKQLRVIGVSIEEFLQYSLSGTPEKIVSKIKEYVKAGVQEFIMYFYNALNIKPLEIFAEKVIPYFR
ncbi:MAG: LLM class F420-dependent oxidoreductase [Thermoprotei archaeon]|nr:MAG: LLM class F420-dependent oxidoreductase [Thermoprotei archaeon]